MSGTQRAHILIPSDLLKEIDALVGPRGRSGFLLETARQEVRRRKLLRFLESETPAWRGERHPEMANDAAAWVRALRKQSDTSSSKKSRRRSRPMESKSSGRTSRRERE
ncbi:MAG: hypothetical protein WCC95_21970 [Candidatus Sulfotelmatobacter sp.]|jgi:hypothetical protein